MKLRKKSAMENLIWLAIKQFSINDLVQFLLDPDESIRMAAARRLQLEGGEFAYEISIQLIESKNKDLKINGIFILGQLSSLGPYYPERVKPILLKSLKNKSNKIKSETIIALGHLGDESIIPFILKFAKSKNENIRIATASTLSRFTDNPTAQQIIEKLSKDISPEVRFWAS